jgi:metal-responsive CopG/Arc/MetJ family transcriptional regulator
MKTAISVEDELLDEADRTAKQMGLSRSRLFSIALQDYLRHRRQAEMSERLNQVYADETRDSGDRETLRAMKAKFRATIRERW